MTLSFLSLYHFRHSIILVTSYQASWPDHSSSSCIPCNWATPWSCPEGHCASSAASHCSAPTFLSTPSSSHNSCFYLTVLWCTPLAPWYAPLYFIAILLGSCPSAATRPRLTSLSASPAGQSPWAPSYKSLCSRSPCSCSALTRTCCTASLSARSLRSLCATAVTLPGSCLAQSPLNDCRLLKLLAMDRSNKLKSPLCCRYEASLPLLWNIFFSTCPQMRSSPPLQCKLCSCCNSPRTEISLESRWKSMKTRTQWYACPYPCMRFTPSRSPRSSTLPKIRFLHYAKITLLWNCDSGIQVFCNSRSLEFQCFVENRKKRRESFIAFHFEQDIQWL